MTPAKIVLTLFNIRFRVENDVKNALNKTAILEKILKKINLQKSLNKEEFFIFFILQKFEIQLSDI